METLEDEIVLQENALKYYLESLLCASSEASIEIPEPESPQPELLLFDSVLQESNSADEQIKVPAWGKNSFSCLPITIGSVTLLVPLRQVRTVLPLRSNITPLTDVPNWMKGVMENFSRSINVVDMQKIVYQDADFSHQAETSQLIVINSGKSGLSCHEVGKVKRLNTEDITWRAKNSARRWIAGVSLTHKLAIVDIRRIEFAIIMKSCSV